MSRYRVESPTLWVTSDEVRVNFRIPDPIYEQLETEYGSPNLKAASRKKVLEAIRLVANETRGGHILCATGQKVYGPSPSEIFYKAEKQKMGGIPYVQLFILKSALISAANGDPDDLAAISAATTGDMVTVELDWGESPEDMKQAIPTDYAKEAAATANKQTILDKIGDCVIYDYADSGLPAETGSGFCAYLDNGDFCIEDMDCHGEHAAQYKVGDIIHPISDGDQTIDLVVAKSVSSTPTDIQLDEYIMYGVTDTILWKKGGYYRVTGIYDVYDSNGYDKLETKLITYEELDPDTVTGLVMQAIERLIQRNQGDPLIRQFFGIVETPDEEVMSETEAIEILEDMWLAVTGSAAPHTDDWDGSGSGSDSGSGSGN